jgi:hypothetical protein
LNHGLIQEKALEGQNMISKNQIPREANSRDYNIFRKNGNSKRNYFKRKFDRERLPTPAHYYSDEFQELKIKSEWVKVRCSFHQDKNPSLNISMFSGGFKCFACGAKGGDIVAFHMQRYGMSFVETVTFFGAWIYEN